VPLGYTRSNLTSAPIIKSMCFLYCRYAILRDIFTNISPSEEDELIFKKWLDRFDEQMKILTDPEKPVQLTDENGEIIVKSGTDSRFLVKTTTPEVKRAVTMDSSDTWNIDGTTYADESVVGEK